MLPLCCLLVARLSLVYACTWLIFFIHSPIVPCITCRIERRRMRSRSRKRRRSFLFYFLIVFLFVFLSLCFFIFLFLFSISFIFLSLVLALSFSHSCFFPFLFLFLFLVPCCVRAASLLLAGTTKRSQKSITCPCCLLAASLLLAGITKWNQFDAYLILKNSLWEFDVLYITNNKIKLCQWETLPGLVPRVC